MPGKRHLCVTTQDALGPTESPDERAARRHYDRGVASRTAATMVRRKRNYSFLNFRYPPTRRPDLKNILSRNPKATLEEIRRSDPVFMRMSPDHLSVQLSQALGHK